MEIRDYLEVLRARKWIIIQAVVVITVGVMVFSLMQPPVYVATSKVMMTEKASVSLFGQMTFPWRSYSSSIETQMELVKSPAVAEQVIQKLKLSTSPQALLDQMQVEQIGETSLIQIHAQDNDPERARDIANAFAIAYVEWSRESSQHESRVLRKELSGEIRDTRKDIFNVGKKIEEKAPNEPVPEDARLKLDLASKFYSMLAEKNQELKINERLQSGNISLVAAATTPQAPITPTSAKNGLLALFGGLVFGCSLAFFVEHLDNTLKTPDDIEKCFGLPLLGQIPHEETSSNGSEGKLISNVHSKSNGAEAFRTLRTNIKYLNFDQSVSSIVVTSGGPQEGKSTILANLAVALAQAGNKVIIICCDLRRPSIHKMFNLSNSEGLSDVLTGKLTLKKALQKAPIAKLKILSSGPLPPNPSEILGSKRMKKIFQQAKEMADIVLIDTPPALAVTDCAVVVPQADGVMLVASVGHTTREAAKQVKARLQSVNARLLGVVLNNVVPGKGYGYYYYYYSNDDGDGHNEKRSRRHKKSHWDAKKWLLNSLKMLVIVLPPTALLFARYVIMLHKLS